MVNFDELPQERPGGDIIVFDKGIYDAEIMKAAMATSKTSGTEYLSVQLQLTDETGKTATVFDSLFDGDKPLLRYKLGQFIRAINCGLTGSFELKDMVKILPNRKLRVAVKVESNEKYGDKNIVDAYDEKIYYPAEAGLPWEEPANAQAADTASAITTGDATY